MILATSCFRVSNGIESAVAEAFRHRPHLVDDTPGFLGMEVFTDTKDPAVFHLLTRWTDERSYRDWHGSAAHKLSHQGIPTGLKLEPGSARILVLERLEEPSDAGFLASLAADAVPVLAEALADSPTLCWLVAATDGTIRRCSRSLAGRLKQTVDCVVGRPVWEFVIDENQSLQNQVAEGNRHYREKRLVNFADADHFPFTLECRIDVQPDSFLLFGEPPLQRDEAAREELFQLNNQLAVLSRENARKSRELEQAHKQIEKTLEDLKTSHWHLRKLQEVLPICMECGKVKSGTRWESVVEYLKQNALFLSHGYCPECFVRIKAEWGLTETGGDR